MNYNVGDKVLVKSIDWYNKNKDANGDVLCFHGVHKFTKEMSKFCGETVTISTNLTGDGEYLIKDDDETDWWTDDMIECKVEEENTDCENCGLTRNSIKCLFMDKCPHNKQKTIIEIPEDWVLKDENGDEILTSKIILEKKQEYPKTYEECAEVLGECAIMTHGYKRDVLNALQKLLVCLHAYWKIAGDKLGLRKPWEPDWREERYIIYRNQDDIIGGYRGPGHVEHHIFEFPIKEIRDAFKENFGSDIEICKEFL